STFTWRTDRSSPSAATATPARCWAERRLPPEAGRSRQLEQPEFAPRVVTGSVFRCGQSTTSVKIHRPSSMNEASASSAKCRLSNPYWRRRVATSWVEQFADPNPYDLRRYSLQHAQTVKVFMPS